MKWVPDKLIGHAKKKTKKKKRRAKPTAKPKCTFD